MRVGASYTNAAAGGRFHHGFELCGDRHGFAASRVERRHHRPALALMLFQQIEAQVAIMRAEQNLATQHGPPSVLDPARSVP